LAIYESHPPKRLQLAVVGSRGGTHKDPVIGAEGAVRLIERLSAAL
jgi:hypothetical protein